MQIFLLMKSVVQFSAYFLIILLICSCNGTTPRRSIPKVKKKVKAAKDTTALHVSYFIENSASNFGYVKGNTNYVDVVSELSQKQDFVSNTTIKQNFNFINGIVNLEINDQGSNPTKFTSKLNKKGMHVGNIKGDDLNAMFQHVLSKADSNSISIFISDAIYDIGKKEYPIKALNVQGKATRSKFASRLKHEGVETLVIKMKSHFNGFYYYGSKHGKIQLDQDRPFYVFVFGSPRLLNKYFSDDYIINELKGYKDQARLIVPNDEPIPYMVTHYEKVGDFVLPKGKTHKLTNVESDSRRDGKFQFTFAVNFSSLNMPESYLQDTASYEANNNFKVLSIESFPSKKIFGAAKINPTHIITVATNSFPAGNLSIHLKNKVPSWVEETNIVDDSNIKGNTNQTFGFKFLINGITDAYLKASNKEDLATFSITLEQ